MIRCKNVSKSFFLVLMRPHGDPGYVNSFFLARASKPQITVALTGDGADELFAGYITFLALKKEKFFSNVPQTMTKLTRCFLQRLLPNTDSYMSTKFKALLFLQGFPSSQDARFSLWLSSLSPESLYCLCPWKDKGFFSRQSEEGTLFGNLANVMNTVKGKTRVQQLLYFYHKNFSYRSLFVCTPTGLQCKIAWRRVHRFFRPH